MDEYMECLLACGQREVCSWGCLSYTEVERQHHCLIPESLNPHPHYWELLTGNRGHPVSFNKISGTRRVKDIVGQLLTSLDLESSFTSFVWGFPLGWNPDFEITILGKERGCWTFRDPHSPHYHSQRCQTLKYTQSISTLEYSPKPVKNPTIYPCLNLPLPQAYLGISPTFPSQERCYHCTVMLKPTQGYPRKPIFLTRPSLIHGS